VNKHIWHEWCSISLALWVCGERIPNDEFSFINESKIHDVYFTNGFVLISISPIPKVFRIENLDVSEISLDFLELCIPVGGQPTILKTRCELVEYSNYNGSCDIECAPMQSSVWYETTPYE